MDQPASVREKTEIVQREPEQIRKLPPRYDINEKGPIDVMYGNSKALISGQEQTRTPILASTTCSSSRSPQKTAPPVPLKPASLTGASQQTLKSSGSLRQDRFPSSSAAHYEGTYPLKLSQLIRPTDDSHKTRLSSQKLSTASLARDSSKKQPDVSQTDGPPLLPQSLKGQASISKGLLDEDDDGAQAIPSLQPLRRS